MLISQSTTSYRKKCPWGPPLGGGPGQSVKMCDTKGARKCPIPAILIIISDENFTKGLKNANELQIKSQVTETPCYILVQFKNKINPKFGL